MKITERTLNILENFRMINPSIRFNEGSVLRTISPNRSVVAFADIDETFPMSVCVYDINQIMKIYKIFNDPILEFKTDKLYLKENETKTSSFCYTSPEMIVYLTDESYVKLTEQSLPNMEFITEVDISEEYLKTMIYACSHMSLANIMLASKDGNIVFRGADKELERSKSQESNDIYFNLGDTSSDFEVVFKAEHIYKLKIQDYKVKFNNNRAVFVNEDEEGRKMTYIIAAEKMQG